MATSLLGLSGSVFQTRAYLEVLDRDVADSIDLVEANLGTELQLARFNQASKDAGRKVYFILSQLLRGPDLLELRRV